MAVAVAVAVVAPLLLVVVLLLCAAVRLLHVAVGALLSLVCWLMISPHSLEKTTGTQRR